MTGAGSSSSVVALYLFISATTTTTTKQILFKKGVAIYFLYLYAVVLQFVAVWPLLLTFSIDLICPAGVPT